MFCLTGVAPNNCVWHIRTVENRQAYLDEQHMHGLGANKKQCDTNRIYMMVPDGASSKEGATRVNVDLSLWFSFYRSAYK